MSELLKEIGRQTASRFLQIANQRANKQTPLLDWANYYLPHHFTKAPSRLHIALADEYDAQRIYRHRKTCIIAPRGNAKTTVALADILKHICEGTEPFIIIVSDTGSQAQTMLATVKQELETNEKLRSDYPLACVKGALWNKDEIHTGNQICVRAFGTGQKVRGIKFRQYRPTKIYVDDPDNDESIRSSTERQNSFEWLQKALLPCGNPDTNFVCVGTMLHRECIVGHLEKSPDFKVIKFQAIMAWPANLALWAEWENLYWALGSVYTENGVVPKDTKQADKFYATHRAEMDEGADVLWPENEDLYFLMKLRAQIGHAAFASEKQNDPRDPSKCEFKEEWFEGEDVWYDEADLRKRLNNPQQQHLSVIYGDPAKGLETKRHDYSPIVTLHLFDGGDFYIEIEMEKQPVTVFTDRLLDWHLLVKPDAISVETTNFQVLIGDEVVAKAQERHMYDVNFIPMDNHGNKTLRISRLSLWLFRRHFKFKRGCRYTLLLIEQLKAFPHGEHDDGPDALEAALRLITMLASPEGEGATEDGFGNSIGR